MFEIVVCGWLILIAWYMSRTIKNIIYSVIPSIESLNKLWACHLYPEVKVKLLDPYVKPITYKIAGDSGMDVSAFESVTIAPRSFALIRTGIAVQLPHGFEIQVRPRSGMQCRKGIVGGWGTVDEGYRGEIGVVLYNHTDEPYQVNAGDRIAQLVVAQVARAMVSYVDEFDGETERGTAGFGSTGK